MAYGQMEGHEHHHKVKAGHHAKLAKHHHAIAAEHEKMAAHHNKMAGSQIDEGEGMDEDQDTVQNTRVGGMFGRGPR